jgi:hypothetical protein
MVTFITESLTGNRLFASCFYTEGIVFVKRIYLHFDGIRATLNWVAVESELVIN